MKNIITQCGPEVLKCHQCVIIKDRVPDGVVFEVGTVSTGRYVQRAMMSG